MKKTIATIFLYSLTFVLGFLFCRFVLFILENNHYVSGIVRYFPKSDPSMSVTPPEGYYIQSEAFEKVYIEHSNISDYLYKKISVKGKIRYICGKDAVTCYPLIKAEYVNIKEFTQEEKIDHDYELCVLDTRSIKEEVDCAAKALNDWEKTQEENLKMLNSKLEERLEEETKRIFEQSQEAWEKYNSEQNKFIDSFYNSFDSSMYLFWRDAAKIKLVKDRTLWIKKYLDIIARSDIRL